MLPAIDGESLQIGLAHAAHERRRAVVRRRAERLALDQRDARASTPGTPAMRSATVGDNRSAGGSSGVTKMWPLKPRILSSSSLRKPFITDMTMISVATPSMMPRKEKPAMTETKPSCAGARAGSASEHPLEGRERLASAARADPAHAGLAVGATLSDRFSSRRRERLVERQTLALAGAALQLDLAVGQALRADDDLPGQADQIHGGELRARPLVAVVVEHVDARPAVSAA